MAWSDARDFLFAELNAGSSLPAEYSIQFTSGPRNGQVFKVIVLTPERTHDLTEVRKRLGMDKYGDQSISFAPTGGCPLCGR